MEFFNFKVGNFLKRFIATVVVITFSVTNTVMAAPVNAQPAVRSSQFDEQRLISPDQGSVEERYAGKSDKTVYYIQDAHESLEAQENISKIITSLVKERGIQTVYEEGYEGPVPTDEYFGNIQDSKVKEKVSYFLLDQLRIGAAEYAHINRAQDFKLIGADSIKLHKENIQAYGQTAEMQKETDQDLQAIQKHLEQLQKKYFPKELKEQLKLRERFDNKQLGLADYLFRLTQLATRSSQSGNELLTANDELRSQYPHLSIITQYLDKTQLTPEESKELETKLKAIDAKALFQEIDQFEQGFVKRCLVTVTIGDSHQTERNLKIYQYSKVISLIQRLNHLEVTTEEYAIVRGQFLTTEELAKFIAQKTHKPLVLSKRWERNIQNAIEFYEIAKLRDQSIEASLSDFLAGTKEKETVLVYGGFHREGIKEILKKLNVSYTVISPKITREDLIHKKYYQILMTKGFYDYELKNFPVSAARVLSDFELVLNRPKGWFRNLISRIESVAISHWDLIGNVFCQAVIRDLGKPAAVAGELGQPEAGSKGIVMPESAGKGKSLGQEGPPPVKVELKRGDRIRFQPPGFLNPIEIMYRGSYANERGNLQARLNIEATPLILVNRVNIWNRIKAEMQNQQGLWSDPMIRRQIERITGGQVPTAESIAGFPLDTREWKPIVVFDTRSYAENSFHVELTVPDPTNLSKTYATLFFGPGTAISAAGPTAISKSLGKKEDLSRFTDEELLERIAQAEDEAVSGFESEWERFSPSRAAPRISSRDAKYIAEKREELRLLNEEKGRRPNLLADQALRSARRQAQSEVVREELKLLNEEIGKRPAILDLELQKAAKRKLERETIKRFKEAQVLAQESIRLFQANDLDMGQNKLREAVFLFAKKRRLVDWLMPPVTPTPIFSIEMFGETIPQRVLQSQKAAEGSIKEALKACLAANKVPFTGSEQLRSYLEQSGARTGWGVNKRRLDEVRDSLLRAEEVLKLMSYLVETEGFDIRAAIADNAKIIDQARKVYDETVAVLRKEFKDAFQKMHPPEKIDQIEMDFKEVERLSEDIQRFYQQKVLEFSSVQYFYALFEQLNRARALHDKVEADYQKMRKDYEDYNLYGFDFYRDPFQYYIPQSLYKAQIAAGEAFYRARNTIDNAQQSWNVRSDFIRVTQEAERAIRAFENNRYEAESHLTIARSYMVSASYDLRGAESNDRTIRRVQRDAERALRRAQNASYGPFIGRLVNSTLHPIAHYPTSLFVWFGYALTVLVVVVMFDWMAPKHARIVSGRGAAAPALMADKKEPTPEQRKPSKVFLGSREKAKEFFEAAQNSVKTAISLIDRNWDDGGKIAEARKQFKEGDDQLNQSAPKPPNSPPDNTDLARELAKKALEDAEHLKGLTDTLIKLSRDFREAEVLAMKADHSIEQSDFSTGPSRLDDARNNLQQGLDKYQSAIMVLGDVKSSLNNRGRYDIPKFLDTIETARTSATLALRDALQAYLKEMKKNFEGVKSLAESSTISFSKGQQNIEEERKWLQADQWLRDAESALAEDLRRMGDQVEALARLQIDFEKAAREIFAARDAAEKTLKEAQAIQDAVRNSETARILFENSRAAADLSALKFQNGKSEEGKRLLEQAKQDAGSASSHLRKAHEKMGDVSSAGAASSLQKAEGAQTASKKALEDAEAIKTFPELIAQIKDDLKTLETLKQEIQEAKEKNNPLRLTWDAFKISPLKKQVMEAAKTAIDQIRMNFKNAQELAKEADKLLADGKQEEADKKLTEAMVRRQRADQQLRSIGELPVLTLGEGVEGLVDAAKQEGKDAHLAIDRAQDNLRAVEAKEVPKPATAELVTPDPKKSSLAKRLSPEIAGSIRIERPHPLSKYAFPKKITPSTRGPEESSLRTISLAKKKVDPKTGKIEIVLETVGVIAELSGNLTQEMFLVQLYDHWENGALVNSDQLRLVPQGTDTGEVVEVTMIVQPLEKGETQQLPMIINGRVVPSTIENKAEGIALTIDESGKLTANEGTHGKNIRLSYTIKRTTQNLKLEGDLQLTQGMPQQTPGENPEDLPPDVKKLLDSAKNKSDQEKLDTIVKILNTYFVYQTEEEAVALPEGKTWFQFLGEELERNASEKGHRRMFTDCSVLGNYAMLFMRYYGIPSVGVGGIVNNKALDQLRTKGGHFNLLIHPHGEVGWLTFEPTYYVPLAKGFFEGAELVPSKEELVKKLVELEKEPEANAAQIQAIKKAIEINQQEEAKRIPKIVHAPSASHKSKSFEPSAAIGDRLTRVLVGNRAGKAGEGNDEGGLASFLDLSFGVEVQTPEDIEKIVANVKKVNNLLDASRSAAVASEKTAAQNVESAREALNALAKEADLAALPRLLEILFGDNEAMSKAAADQIIELLTANEQRYRHAKDLAEEYFKQDYSTFDLKEQREFLTILLVLKKAEMGIGLVVREAAHNPHQMNRRIAVVLLREYTVAGRSAVCRIAAEPLLEVLKNQQESSSVRKDVYDALKNIRDKAKNLPDDLKGEIKKGLRQYEETLKKLKQIEAIEFKGKSLGVGINEPPLETWSEEQLVDRIMRMLMDSTEEKGAWGWRPYLPFIKALLAHEASRKYLQTLVLARGQYLSVDEFVSYIDQKSVGKPTAVKREEFIFIINLLRTYLVDRFNTDHDLLMRGTKPFAQKNVIDDVVAELESSLKQMSEYPKVPDWQFDQPGINPLIVQIYLNLVQSERDLLIKEHKLSESRFQSVDEQVAGVQDKLNMGWGVQESEIKEIITRFAKLSVSNKTTGKSLGAADFAHGQSSGILRPILTDKLVNAFKELNGGKPIEIVEVDGESRSNSLQEAAVDFNDIKTKIYDALARIQVSKNISGNDFVALLIRRDHQNGKDPQKNRQYYRIIIDRADAIWDRVNAFWLEDELGKYEFITEFSIYPKMQLAHLISISMGRKFIEQLRGKGLTPLKETAEALEANYSGYTVFGVPIEAKHQRSRIIPNFMQKYFSAVHLPANDPEVVRIESVTDFLGDDKDFVYVGKVGSRQAERAEASSLGAKSFINDPRLPRIEVNSPYKALGTVVRAQDIYAFLESNSKYPGVLETVIEQVAKLQNDNFENHRPVDSFDISEWREDLQTRADFYLLLNPSGKVSGFLWFDHAPGKKKTYLTAIASDRQDGVRGKGTYLMDAFFQELKRLGKKTASWDCYEDSRVFYQKYLESHSIVFKPPIQRGDAWTFVVDLTSGAAMSRATGASLGAQILGSSLGAGRQELIRWGQQYVDIISEGDDFSKEVPDAFLVFGNPDLKTILGFAEQWKEFQKQTEANIPVVLVGGRGRGTVPLALRTKEHYSASLSPKDKKWLKKAISGEAVDGKPITEAEIIRFILIKEGLPDPDDPKKKKVLYLEEVPSKNTVENFKNNAELLQSAIPGIPNPTIALVTWAPLLMRLEGTALKQWEDAGLTRWKVKKLRVYKPKLKTMSDDDRIELIGYVAGYPEKYRKLYPNLNSGTEFGGSHKEKNPNVKTVEMTPARRQEVWNILAETQRAFEKYLNSLTLVYDDQSNQLKVAQSLGQARKHPVELSLQIKESLVAAIPYRTFSRELAKDAGTKSLLNTFLIMNPRKFHLYISDAPNDFKKEDYPDFNLPNVHTEGVSGENFIKLVPQKEARLIISQGEIPKGYETVLGSIDRYLCQRNLVFAALYRAQLGSDEERKRFDDEYGLRRDDSGFFAIIQAAIEEAVQKLQADLVVEQAA